MLSAAALLALIQVAVPRCTGITIRDAADPRSWAFEPSSLLTPVEVGAAIGAATAALAADGPPPAVSSATYWRARQTLLELDVADLRKRVTGV